MKYRTGVKSESHFTGADFTGACPVKFLSRWTRRLFNWGTIVTAKRISLGEFWHLYCLALS